MVPPSCKHSVSLSKTFMDRPNNKTTKKFTENIKNTRQQIYLFLSFSISPTFHSSTCSSTLLVPSLSWGCEYFGQFSGRPVKFQTCTARSKDSLGKKSELQILFLQIFWCPPYFASVRNLLTYIIQFFYPTETSTFFPSDIHLALQWISKHSVFFSLKLLFVPFPFNFNNLLHQLDCVIVFYSSTFFIYFLCFLLVRVVFHSYFHDHGVWNVWWDTARCNSTEAIFIKLFLLHGTAEYSSVSSCYSFEINNYSLCPSNGRRPNHLSVLCSCWPRG